VSADQERHEPYDVAARPVLAAATALLVVLVLVGVGQLLLLRYYERRGAEVGREPLPVVDQREPPAPRLLADPRAALLALRAEEDGLLHGYAWVNRDAGVVRIPIERAMELLAAPPARGAAR
jgi:hypothetical protein